MKHLLEYLAEENVLVLDLETTGVSRNDEFIEIAVVEGLTGKVLIDTLVRPTCLIHPAAYKVHGISYEHLMYAPYIEDVAFNIYKILDGRVVAAFNSNFDKRLLEQTFNKQSLRLPNIKAWHCLMEMSSKLFGKKSLTDICRELKIKGGEHTAVSDALAAARLFYKLRKIHAD